MAVITEPSPTAGTPAPAARPSRKRGWRDLRGTILTVLVLLLASGIAVAIAYASRGSSAPSGDVQARTVDFKVLMPSTLSAGKHTIGYTNDGKVEHEIVMFATALPANRLPLDANGDVQENSPLLTKVGDSGDALKPGGAKSFPTSSLTPGHYVAVCNLPGHYGLGMRLDVRVP